MIPQPALRRPQRQMMLHAIPAEHRRRTVVPVDRQRHRQGALRILQPRPFILRDFQAVSHRIKLPTRHLEYWMVVNFHARILAKTGRPVQPHSVLINCSATVTAVRRCWCDAQTSSADTELNRTKARGLPVVWERGRPAGYNPLHPACSILHPCPTHPSHSALGGLARLKPLLKFKKTRIRVFKRVYPSLREFTRVYLSLAEFILGTLSTPPRTVFIPGPEGPPDISQPQSGWKTPQHSRVPHRTPDSKTTRRVVRQ
jgi:hypothetical protein